MPKPKNKREARNCTLPPIRCTQSEREEINYYADSVNESLSNYVRSVALKNPLSMESIAKSKGRSHAEILALNDLTLEVRRIGVNFNQIARKINATGFESSDISRISKTLDEIMDKLLDEVMPT